MGPCSGLGMILSATILTSLSIFALKLDQNSFIVRPAGLKREALSRFPMGGSGGEAAGGESVDPAAEAKRSEEKRSEAKRSEAKR